MKILVTGGTSGLGEALVKILLAAGHTVHFTYCGNAVKAQELLKTSPNACLHKCDFRDMETVENLCHELKQTELDALVNNAFSGHFLERQCHRNDLGIYQQIFQNNILPTLRITHELLNCFKKQHHGRIITILTSGLIGIPPVGSSAYVAAKAYLAQMSRCWAAEYIRYGITANTVSPSFMKTNFTSDLDERLVESIISTHPLGRLLDCNDAAKAVEFLLYAPLDINGIDIPVTAGAAVHS
ncbi:MAG: SDR family NAD(P)-dependent oxidoreductase [Spirochaetia bacterium]|nr:SDR family NAD(P)-dependent oxidoreductase [Spirochaetia bacterium]